MRLSKNTFLFLLIMVFGTLVTLQLLKWEIPIATNTVHNATGVGVDSNDPNAENKKEERKFLLDSASCRIPDIDPFDNSEDDDPLNITLECHGKPSITYVEGSYLRLNWTRIRDDYNGDFKYCEYQPVFRGRKRSDFAFEYGEMADRFDHDILVPPEHEYMRVYCYSKSEGKISTNYHAAVTLKKDVEERSNILFEKHKRENKPNEIFNVHMIGMDSVSRLNFIRRLPRTRQFLLNDLQAFEMTGYNKVADNTFVNILPLMVGKFVKEVDWNETSKKTFDNYNFFWKNFSQAGYRTLYAEDHPKIAIFVYQKEGFRDPPADYYNRALALTMERHKGIWSEDHNCIVDKLETKYLLDYITDFSRVFKDKPHFGFTFITRLTHDKVSLVGAADAPYYDFLKRFKEEGHFNNTILILYSDHGYRFGSDRNTYMGKIEERLPMLYLVFPPKFHKKYPNLVQNLRKNSRRLTTPFDIYETLKDILYFDGEDRKASVFDRGISLIREIPKGRGCRHAQILPHWCLCLEEKKVDRTSKLAIRLGRALVKIINEILTPEHNKCAKLRVGKIESVVKMESNDKILRFDNVFNDVINRTIVYGNKTQAPVVYQITMKVTPGIALLEATLTHEPVVDEFKLAGDVSRINSYGKSADCIGNFRLKKFCHCLR